MTGDAPVAEAVPVKKVDGYGKFSKVEIVCKENKLYALKDAMMAIGITGMTVSHVMGCGLQKGKPEYYRGVPVEANLFPKVQVDIVISKVPVRTVIDTAKKVLYTGHIGDGKIFIYDVENVIKVRTGEEGFDALQDVEYSFTSIFNNKTYAKQTAVLCGTAVCFAVYISQLKKPGV